MAVTLEDVVAELRQINQDGEQTKTGIIALLNQQKKEAEEYRRQAGKREEARREASRKSTSSKPTGLIGGLKQGAVEASGFEMLGKWSSAILGGLFGGATIASITGAIGRLVGRGVIFGGAAALVGGFGETLFKSLFDSLDPGDFVSQEFKDNFASSLASAASLGTLGLIFGRRLGAALFVGSLVGDGIKSLFDEETLNTKFLEGFGASFDVGDIVAYGSMIAAFFGPAMIGNALHSQFTGAKFDPKSNRWRSPYGGYMSEANAKAFNKQFRPKMSFGGRVGWAAVIGVAGATLAGFISTHMGEGMGEVTSWGMTGASLGMMFGPQGAIAGALIGFALAGGAKVMDWLNNKRNENLDNLNKEIDKLQASAQAKADAGDYEGAKKDLAMASAEIQRQAEIDSKAVAAQQALESAEQREKLKNLTRGEKLNNVVSKFTAIMQSDLSESEKITKAREALKQFAQLTGATDPRIAYSELVGEMRAIGQSKSLAMGLTGQITQNITIGQVGDNVSSNTAPPPKSVKGDMGRAIDYPFYEKRIAGGTALYAGGSFNTLLY